jgi:hypothetical protein
MPHDKPIFSIERNSEFYHDNTSCTDRNSIETKNLRVGTGGKKLCPQCHKLNLEEARIAMQHGNLGLARQLARGSELS